MGISVNGPSGIDTKSLIDQLVAIEQQKVTKVQTEKNSYQVKIDAYSKLQSLLSDFQTKATSFSKLSTFDLFKTTSSNEKVVTMTGGTGSVDSQYDMQVFQLATNEKMISRDGKITSQTATLTSQGVTVGDISIDGTKITIDDNDTIQDLRSKINSATDSKGNKLNVAASVVKISDNNFRLVLTAKNTGATGITYKDETGSVFQDLGIIQSDGSKGNISQKLTSADSIQQAFDDLADGEAIQFSGTDRNGQAVAGSFIKTAGSTIDDFLKQIKSAYNNLVDVSVDNASGGTGKLTITDKTTGTSKLSMTSLTFGSTSPQSHAVSITDLGKEGAGVLSTGKDAFFSVEQIAMQSSSNSASGFVNGATFELHGISDPGETVSLNINRDLDAVKQKLQDLVDCYNSLVQFEDDETKHKDPNDSNSQDGDLAGDMTISSIVSQVNNVFHQQNQLFGGKYTSLTMIGLKTDPQTGKFSIDDDMFEKATTDNLDEVLKLFTNVGQSNNNSVTMGRKTIDTQSGNYVLEEVDADHIKARLQGGTDWYTSDARTGDIVSFSDGPLKGLSITAASGSLNGTDANFTYSKGLGETLNEILNKFTDSHEGLITMRQDSMRKSMDYDDERIQDLQDRVDAYRTRLTKQFSDMETALQNMQNQYAKMVSSLSSSSSE